MTEPGQSDAWADRARMLADARKLNYAYAEQYAAEVPAEADAFAEEPGKVNDYPEHHQLFTADEAQTTAYREAALQVLQGDDGALTAHAGCDEFCRNPLHPGPCRGWRRQKDRAPHERRDKGAPPPQRRAAKKAVPPAPAAPPPAKAVTPTPVARESVPDPDNPVLTPAEARTIRDALTPPPGTRQQPLDQAARDAITKIFTIDDPASGLRTQVDSVRAYGYGRESSADVSIRIMNRDGQPVGSSTRRITRNGTSLSVYHAYLQLSASTQGGGFASRYNDQAFRAYAEMGVAGVTVHANIDVGGYTWATQGFDFQGRSDLDIFVRRFETFRASLDRLAQNAGSPTTGNIRGNVAGQSLLPDEALRLRGELDALLARSTREHWEAGTHPTPFEFSQLGSWLPFERPTGRGDRTITSWLGKSVLLGSSWHGRRPITRRTRRGSQPVPGVPQTVKKTAKRAPRKATAAIEDVPMQVVEPQETEARAEQYDFLDAAWEVYLAYAQLMGDTVPAYPEDATPNDEGGTEYPAAQQMISANADQSQPWLDAVEELLDMWGRAPEEE